MSLRSKSSPIHSLPPEVLSRIFQSYCDIYHPLNADCICFKTSIYSLEDARIIIQKVCRLWRATALADPRLWATVTLYVPSCMKASSDSRRGTQEKQSYLRIAKERLARSGDLPLTLAFQFFEWHIATVEDSIRLFQMFLDVLPRVEHLVMDVEFRDEWDDGVLAGKPSPLASTYGIPTALRTLRTGRSLWEQEFLFRVRSIRGLELCIPHEALGSLDAQRIPTATITALSIQHVLFPSVLKLLQHVPQLEELALKDIVEPLEISASSIPSSKIFLSYLHRLTIRGACTEGVEHGDALPSPTTTRAPWNPVEMLLNQLSLPALQHLNITALVKSLVSPPDESGNELTAWPGLRSVAFFRRSRCALLSLVVKASSIDEEGMIAVLENQRDTLIVLELDVRPSLPSPVVEFLSGIAQRQQI
ncbi:hypothetical protein BDZ89DRAFT_1115700 [Hymenopellis radicata]|nr:hypothetical protein BDZ89DRAFT_1115700 [Hymenopellis radicata]